MDIIKIESDNIDILYNKPSYNIGPRGGHPADSLNRKYITSEEAMKL